MKPIISIIVPAYNQEKYLGECLESIASQTFTDFEAIIVDDGSTDSTASICQEFVHRDDRFRLVRKPNGGVSSARNVGLDLSEGEYVCFFDSDDVIPSDCLQNHYSHFSPEVDLTLGAFTWFTDDGANCLTVPVEKDELKTVSDCLRDFVPNGAPDWHRYIWNRMFRKAVISANQLRFNEKLAYKEDGLFLVQYLLRCSGKVAYFPAIVYHYRQNPSSANGCLNSTFTRKLLTDLEGHILLVKEMKTFHVDAVILNGQIGNLFSARNWILGIMKKYGNPTFRFRIVSLIRSYNAVGLKYAAKHFCSHLKKTLIR